MSNVNRFVMVAGIDFGTTFSGYAFSFLNSATDIKINKNWGTSQGFTSYKAPTCVLFDSDGIFEAFGYEAEEKYIEDQESDSAGARKRLYRNFKMMLHTNKNVNLNTTVSSVCHTKAPAIDIFVSALSYLKEHLLTELSNQLARTVKEDMIRWVITVPAIWSDESKLFMREAALRAGYISHKNSEQLVISLEPEAASFFCRQLDFRPSTGPKQTSFSSGTKYLVLDCGGGTNDMVVHQVVRDFKIKELQAANGGNLGGNAVTEEFVKLLGDILGQDFITEFERSFPQQWFELMMNFERAKKLAADDGDSRMKIILPYGMESSYNSLKGKSIKSVLNDPDRGIRFVSGSIVLANTAVKRLFDGVVKQIAKGVQTVIEQGNLSDLKYILMVGGFSESSFLQKAIKANFGSESCQVLIPQESQLAVIRGAVLFGHHEDQVVSRIARKTYGIEIRDYFDENIHDKAFYYIDEDGFEMCGNVFMTLVKIGKEVKLDQIHENVFYLASHQELAEVPIYTLNRRPSKPVQYCNAFDAVMIGICTLYAPIKSTNEGDRANKSNTQCLESNDNKKTNAHEIYGVEVHTYTNDQRSDRNGNRIVNGNSKEFNRDSVNESDNECRIGSAEDIEKQNIVLTNKNGNDIANLDVLAQNYNVEVNSKEGNTPSKTDQHSKEVIDGGKKRKEMLANMSDGRQNDEPSVKYKDDADREVCMSRIKVYEREPVPVSLITNHELNEILRNDIDKDTSDIVTNGSKDEREKEEIWITTNNEDKCFRKAEADKLEFGKMILNNKDKKVSEVVEASLIDDDEVVAECMGDKQERKDVSVKDNVKVKESENISESNEMWDTQNIATESKEDEDEHVAIIIGQDDNDIIVADSDKETQNKDISPQATTGKGKIVTSQKRDSEDTEALIENNRTDEDKESMIVTESDETEAMTQNDSRRKVRVCFCFGRTELHVEVIDEASGNKESIALDFHS